MDWDFLTASPMPPQSQLLHGCCLEAERADRVAQGLDGLRGALTESFHGHMVALTEEIRRSSKILRDLADQSRVHSSRVPIVSNHLNVVLPCMSRSLRDITAHYDNKTLSRELRWRTMYYDMSKESGGMGPPQRFMMYNHFLGLLFYLLVRDKNFDPGQLEALRSRILDLRSRRGIPEPAQSPAAINAAAAAAATTASIAGPDQLIRQATTTTTVIPFPPRERVGAGAGAGAAASAAAAATHWCEQVFAQPPSSHTDMGLPDRSRAFGPWSPNDDLHPRRTLLRRSFDNDRLCVTFIEADDGRGGTAPWVVITRIGGGGGGGGGGGAHYVSYQGHHELCVLREGNALVLKRWSRSARCAKDWAMLSFVTWEELVLFYCTFIALKARNHLTVAIDPLEYKLKGEKRRFQAQIVDDDYKHSLIVYEDIRTGGTRLLAAAWDGELRQCPVWTAFVTHISASPTWLVRESKHLVLVKDIQLYVFCHKYSESNMRRNKSGAFELYFVGEQAADKFIEVFFPPRVEPYEIEEAVAGPSHP